MPWTLAEIFMCAPGAQKGMNGAMMAQPVIAVEAEGATAISLETAVVRFTRLARQTH